MGRRPGEDRDGVTDLDAETVDEPAEADQTEGVSRLEGRIDVTVLLVRPTQLGVEHRLQEGEDLPVDVVDRRGEEKQGQNDPSVRGGSGV